MKPHRLDRTMGWRAGIAAALAVGGLLAAPSSGDAMATSPVAAGDSATARFIVQSDGDNPLAIGRAAVDLGGRLVATQEALGTVVVDLPVSTANRLREVSGVQAVTADGQVRLQSAGVGPTGENGDMTNVARLTGATTFWQNGFSGQGVDVALLDSGVVPVEGLLTPNKLVIGPDLSFEAQLPNLASLDTFGHGTHMAGIIAGRDAGLTPETYAAESTRFMGIAPGARIVSIKLADAQGNTGVSQVLAAIDWVLRHSRDAGLNIRVMNLSFGAEATRGNRLDPLEFAAEAAWERGLVVVASAGNGDGTTSGLTSPARARNVLSVGAVDTQGTQDPADDVVPAFSRSGDSAQGLRAPDLVAPGASIVGLRAKGSYVDAKFAARAAIGDRFFKGSGTSQSAAVVSGAAALLLSQRPGLSPDQVRDVLRRSARPVPGTSTDAQGAGSLDLAAAYTTAPSRSLAGARPMSTAGLDVGSHFTVDERGLVPAGTKETRHDLKKVTKPDDRRDNDRRDNDRRDKGSTEPEQPSRDTWAGEEWAGSPLLGATWAGDHWTGATWAGATWAGATWAGATWAGATWAAGHWSGATWAGATWAGATWANAFWASADWR